MYCSDACAIGVHIEVCTPLLVPYMRVLAQRSLDCMFQALGQAAARLLRFAGPYYCTYRPSVLSKLS